MPNIITRTEFHRELARLTREAYPQTGMIPWYRLLVSACSWQPQTARYGRGWARYDRIAIMTLRDGDADLYRAIHYWYVAETKGDFTAGLNPLACIDEETYPVPRAREVHRRGIYDGKVHIDWTSWGEFFEAAMIVAFDDGELDDDEEDVLVEHLGGAPDERAIMYARGMCAGVEALMPPSWCDKTFNVLSTMI